MSAEVSSGIGQAVGGAVSVGVESMAPAGPAMSDLAEPMGSLGNFATEAPSIPTAFEPTDFSVFERAFEPSAPIQFSTINSSVVQNDAFIPSLDKDIFSRTVEFNPQPQVLEQPATLDSLKNMEVIWSAQDQFSPAISIEEPEALISTIDSPDIEIPVTKMENLVPNINMLSATEIHGIEKDLEVAQNVQSLLLDIGFPQTSALEITQRSLNAALERKGINLTETNDQVQEDVDNEVKVDPGLDLQKKAQVNQAVGLKDDEEVEEDESEKEKQKGQPVEVPIFVKDEDANEERRKDARQAIDKTFSEDEEKKDGSEIVAGMNSSPTINETSEIVRKIAGSADGSYEEVLEDIKATKFSSKEEAENTVNSVIEEKPAVKLGKFGKAVREKDVRRVLKTNYAAV